MKAIFIIILLIIWVVLGAYTVNLSRRLTQIEIVVEALEDWSREVETE